MLAAIGAAGIVTAAPAEAAAGASTPFTEYLAANSPTNGVVLAPNYNFGALASEATGRQAVQLIGQGKYVSFTLGQSANAVDFHYAIPDSLAGGGITAPLSLYVGNTLATSLSLTSQYSWLYGSNPPAEPNQPAVGDPNIAVPHDFYNDVRYQFASTLPAGTVVKLQVDAGDNAPWYAINAADFETVGAAIAAPAGSIDATKAPYNVDNSGVTDTTTALQNAVTAASQAGATLYMPPGTYQVTSPIYVNKVTIQGAGEWYTTMTGHSVEFAGQIGNPSTNVNVSDLSMYGGVSTRDDSDGTVHGFNGGFTNSTISRVWIQNEKVGIWVVGPTDNLKVDSVRIQDTTADGINFHGAVTNSTVSNSFIRNVQDDGWAIWSNPQVDSSDTFNQNTVDSPGIANNVGLYGGRGITVTNNLLQDTVTRGGGIGIGNRFGATSLAGTTTISGNKLVRDGQFDPGWDYGVGAIWFWPLESALTGTVNISNNEIDNSPYEAIQFQNSAPPVGSAITTQGTAGNATSNVTLTNNTVNGVGTYVLQEQSPGAVSISGLTATNVGVAGVMNCNSGLNVTAGAGNSGWSTTACGMPAAWPLYTFPTTTTFENASVGQATPTQKVTIYNAGASAASLGAISASSGFSVTPDSSKPCGASLDGTTPTDANAWCQVDVSFTAPASGITTGTLTIPSNQPGNPTVLQLVGSTGGNNVNTPPTVTPGSLAFGSVNVGSSAGPKSVVVANPGAAAISISSVAVTGPYSQTDNCGSTLAGGASCTVNVTFTPTAGGAANGTVAITNSATATPIGATLTGTGVTSTTNLALGAVMSASSSVGGFPASNANDNDFNTYWESANGAFPQWLQADLGSAQQVGSVTLTLPPATSWSTRTQTLSIQGSSDGTTFTNLVGSAGYTFDPATGNKVSVSLPTSTVRYLRLNFTGNTGWPAGQISEFEIFPGGGGSGGSATLAASPASLAFGSQVTGTTSTAEAVTVSNTGTQAASISSVSASGPFAQTDNCGTSLASGASCTVNVTFTPTATGAASGSVTVTGSASNSPLSIALTGTGTTAGSATLAASPSSLAFGSQLVGSTSAAKAVTVSNTGTQAASISSVSAGGSFAQTNNCGNSIAAGASCTVNVTFSPTATGVASGSVVVTSSASNSPLSIALTGTGTTASNPNLALHQPTSESGHTQTYGSGNVVDGNTGTYWESVDNAFPQWVQVDLGASTTVGRIVLNLPPAWGARTETLSVLGSTNGSTFTTVVGSAGYTFNPSTGNTVTITFSGTSARYLRLNFTANTGWPAGQVSEFQVFAS